jgi:hypothetical protein
LQALSLLQRCRQRPRFFSAGATPQGGLRDHTLRNRGARVHPGHLKPEGRRLRRTQAEFLVLTPVDDSQVHREALTSQQHVIGTSGRRTDVNGAVVLGQVDEEPNLRAPRRSSLGEQERKEGDDEPDQKC